MMHWNKISRSCMTLPLLMAIPAQALADSSTVLSDFEEIIVSAQKRDQSLGDIPLAVSAMTGTDLQAMGVLGSADLARLTPSLALVQTGPGQNTVSIRGVTSSYNLAPTVSVYIDETPLDFRTDARASASDTDFFDVSRVEVLRGPQGTLFGASSLGGTLRIIQNQAVLGEHQLKAEASGSTVKGGGEGYAAKAAVNLPVGETLAIRASVSHQKFPGYTKTVFPVDYFAPSAADPVTDDENGRNERTFLRLAATWQPSETLKFQPSVIYQKSNVDGYNQSDSNRDKYTYANQFTPEYTDEMVILNLLASKDLGFAELTSSSSYVDRDTFSVEDYSALSAKIYADIMGTTEDVPELETLNYFPVNFESWSQELRLASSGEQRLGWLVGGFFQKVTNDTNQVVESEEFGAFLAGLFGIPATSDIIGYYSPIKDRQFAGFADLTYEVMPSVSISAGLRAYDLKQTITITQTGILAGPFTPTVTSKQSGVNPRANIMYKIDEDAMIYASASKGFRAGGGNAALIAPPDACLFGDAYNPSYGSDTVWNFETGQKATLFDGVLSINSAIYQINWNKIQGLVRSDCGAFIANIGKARVRGIESEVVLKPVDGLALRASFSYNDAEIRSINPEVVGIGVNAGDRVIDVPKTNFSVGADYTREIKDDLQLFMRAGLQRVGSTPTSYTTNDARTIRDAYTNVNAALGVGHGPFQLELQGQNLTNSFQVHAINFGGLPVPPDAARYTVASPRMFMLILRYSMN